MLGDDVEVVAVGMQRRDARARPAARGRSGGSRRCRCGRRCSSPSTRTSPRLIVVLPLAESPTTPRMTGRGITARSRSLPWLLDAACGSIRGGCDPAALRRSRRLVDPVGVAQAAALHRVAHAAGVREPRAAPRARATRAARPRRRAKARRTPPVEHQPADRHQLVGPVVREVDVVGDARGHARVQREELVHRSRYPARITTRRSRSFSITCSRISIASTP